MNFTRTTLEKIEIIFEEQEYLVRCEKGNFNSGYCILEEHKVVVINKFFDLKGRINILLDILSTILVIEEKLSNKSLHFFKQILKSQEYQSKA